MPVVKCNCGNPLKEPKHGLGDIKVEIPDHLGERWKHDKDKDVIVRPGKKKVGKFVLRDVDRPGRVIDRPVGPATGDTTRKNTGSDASDSGDGEGVLVPDLQGMSREEATRTLAQAGLTAQITEEPSGTAGADTVITQSPDPGTSLEPGATVTLVIATASVSPEPTGPVAEPTEPEPPLPSVEPTQPEPSTEPTPQQTPG
ncbi:PASTA domain-containing protein [Streptomyces sp. NPDC005355]|uniref:PASTA domain-containing protein n=1 Tax=Streptomyces sp. NPDC005355 TaxID=3157038 RepID=UPI0033AC69DD